MATDTSTEERLSAAFKRWDDNRTLLHHKRRQLAAASAAHQRGDREEPIVLSIEVKCIDEICELLFAQLMAIANAIDGARDSWAALAAHASRCR